MSEHFAKISSSKFLIVTFLYCLIRSTAAVKVDEIGEEFSEIIFDSAIKYEIISEEPYNTISYHDSDELSFGVSYGGLLLKSDKVIKEPIKISVKPLYLTGLTDVAGCKGLINGATLETDSSHTITVKGKMVIKEFNSALSAVVSGNGHLEVYGKVGGLKYTGLDHSVGKIKGVGHLADVDLKSYSTLFIETISEKVDINGRAYGGSEVKYTKGHCTVSNFNPRFKGCEKIESF